MQVVSKRVRSNEWVAKRQSWVCEETWMFGRGWDSV